MEIENYQLEFVVSEKGAFIKFYENSTQYKPIIWAKLRKVQLKNNEHTISFRQGLITHGFSFSKYCAEMYKLEYSAKILHKFGVNTHIGVITQEQKDELSNEFKKYC